MFHEQTWPENVRSAAAALVTRLFARGPIQQSIDAMNDEAVGEMLIELEQFVRLFEAVNITDADPELQCEN